PVPPWCFAKFAISFHLPELGVKLVPVPFTGTTIGWSKPGLLENSNLYRSSHVALQVNVGAGCFPAPPDESCMVITDPSAGVSGTIAHPPPQGTIRRCTHPVAGSQESVVQELPSPHSSVDPLLQAPAEHVSPVVQAFPSSH